MQVNIYIYISAYMYVYIYIYEMLGVVGDCQPGIGVDVRTGGGQVHGVCHSSRCENALLMVHL